MSTGLRLRPGILAAREKLAAGRAQLKEQHRQGESGTNVSWQLAELMESIVKDLFDVSLEDAWAQHGEVSANEQADILSQVALLPNSGFGRRDVAPFSDVDLMLLTTPAAQSAAGELARHFTRNLCDGGLQVGFSLRTSAEACQWALQDATVLTSLVECRFLAGNETLFQQFWKEFRQLVQRRWRPFVTAAVKARWEERQQFGETAYLLEPNVKRSRGGLRDIQSVRWVGFLRYGERELPKLAEIGALTPSDLESLNQAHEFLLRLRNEMGNFFRGA